MNAIAECAEYRVLYGDWVSTLEGATHQNLAMMAKALAIQQAGVIPMHTDPEWVMETINSMDMESLR